MEITKKSENGKMTIAVSGRVDTVTAPELEAAMTLADVKELTIDLAGVPYMSSAGLRCLLMAQKKMMAQGGAMVIVGTQSAVKEVFDITGFSEILTLA